MHNSNRFHSHEYIAYSMEKYNDVISIAYAGEKNQSNQPMRVVVYGPPASGKGTQCEIIAKQFGVVHLSTGEMLRAAMRDNTPLGEEVRSYMDQSKLVPDDIMIRIVTERLAQEDCTKRGWVLDGYPRTENQAKALLSSGVKPDRFILLDVPQRILLERVEGRRSDPLTGKVYHLKFNPPESAEVAQRLIQRHDDTTEKMQVRLRDYDAHTAPVRAYFGDMLLTVNGSVGSRESIARTIFDALSDGRVQSNKRSADQEAGSFFALHKDITTCKL